MKRIDINDTEAIKLATKVLSSGGIVMHPTETCYGFAVDVFNEKALNKLFLLKGRDAKKPLSIMVSSLDMAQKYGDFSGKALDLAEKYWPGPLSIVVPRKSSLPAFFNQTEEFVSIRYSDYPFCSELVKEFGKPIVTTSANLSGMPPFYKVELAQFKDLVEKIDLVVDGGELVGNKPSTVVRIEGAKIAVLRQGGIEVENVDAKNYR